MNSALDKKPLSIVQKRILLLMREHKFVRFGYAHRGGVQNLAVPGGLMICAYQSPWGFLKTRGLIDNTTNEIPGVWFTLTEHGRTRANALYAKQRG